MIGVAGKHLNERWLTLGLIILFLLLPLHAFLTTWAGEVFGRRGLWQAWKEALVLVLALGVAWRLIKDRALRKFLASYWPNRLILVYATLHFLLAVVSNTPRAAVLLGLRNNLIFLTLFVITQTLAFYVKPRQLTNKLVKIVLITTAVVAGFGLLQAYILPADWLTKFGYGPETIVPYLLVQDSQIVRIIATLDSPTTLGSWLILPWSLALTMLIERKLNQWWWLLLPVIALALYHSHSRSAWIGLGLASILILWKILPRRWLRRVAIASCLAVLAVAVAIAIWLPKSVALQSVLLHSPIAKAADLSSNDDHWELLTIGAREVAESPLGRGPGTAGPASYETSQPIITENHFLQIAIEVGLIGLGLWLALNIWVIKDLWLASRASLLALALFASFVGLTFMNLLQHTWANGPTALTWWGLAGLAIGWFRLNPKSTADNARSHS